MQAIQTKYHGPTNTRGSRISATAYAGRKYYGYDYSLNLEDNHKASATEYMDSKGWLHPVRDITRRIEGGQLPDGSFVWVLVEY